MPHELVVRVAIICGMCSHLVCLPVAPREDQLRFGFGDTAAVGGDGDVSSPWRGSRRLRLPFFCWWRVGGKEAVAISSPGLCGPSSPSPSRHRPLPHPTFTFIVPPSQEFSAHLLGSTTAASVSLATIIHSYFPALPCLSNQKGQEAASPRRPATLRNQPRVLEELDSHAPPHNTGNS